MARRTHESLYYADDKDLSDLMLASPKQLSPERLVQFIRQRGLIISKELGPADIVSYVSRLPFSWVELQRLSTLTVTADRSEKRETKRVSSSSIKDADIKRATKTLETSRGKRGEVVNIVATDAGYRVQVKYSEVDATRNRLMQKTQKELDIEVNLTKDGISVRHESNDRALSVVNELINELKTSDKKLRVREIDLGVGASPAVKTKFFLDIASGLVGFNLADITGVKVLSPGDGAKGGAKKLEGLIKHAQLSGSGIQNTQEYRNLVNAGFYVSRIDWLATEKKKDGVQVAFMAELQEPRDGARFRYGLGRVTERDDEGDFRRSSRRHTEEEKARWSDKIERAAYRAATKAKKKT
ncbi:MAG: hypothetical protein RIT81_30645 [Deltaproteobacteria bacterium]